MKLIGNQSKGYKLVSSFPAENKGKGAGKGAGKDPGKESGKEPGTGAENGQPAASGKSE